MALEIEHKFLLRDSSWRAGVERSIPMKQAYLGGDGVSIRIRLYGEEANINIKQMRLGHQREEFECPVPLEDGLRLFQLAAGGQVEKTRHHVHYEGMLWEIDEFEGRNAGLVVAEIELEEVGQYFARPPWAGREVTNEDRYYNIALALQPYDSWETS
jgi:adenylate cyclase